MLVSSFPLWRSCLVNSCLAVYFSAEAIIVPHPEDILLPACRCRQYCPCGYNAGGSGHSGQGNRGFQHDRHHRWYWFERTLLSRTGSDAAVSGDEARAVRVAVAALPAEQRRALELAFFGGLTQEQIAAQLREPLGTIKARIRRGLIKLRTSLVPSP